MIDLPNLPHDNLYKFIAFAGLAILIASNYLYFTWLNELDRMAVDLQSRHQSHVSRHETEDTLIKGLERRIDSSDDKAEIRATADKIIQILTASQAESHNIDADLNAYKAREEQVAWNRSIQSVGSGLGVLMLLIGLWQWYVKIQRPQDLLLKSQIELGAKTEAPAAKSEPLYDEERARTRSASIEASDGD